MHNRTINYEKYMFTSEMIKTTLNCNLQPASTQRKERPHQALLDTKKTETSFFIPKEVDGLFWCFYVISRGFAAYEYPGATSFANEKAEKFKLIEKLRTTKQALKCKKIKNVKEDVEDELANKSKIGMKTFIALCIAENINVLFINKRKCFELVFDEDAAFHVVHKYDNPEKYCYEMNCSPDDLKKYRTTFFNWESMDKPIKAMSSYKTDELLELCKRLGLDEKVDNLNKKTKKDLYELLICNL